MVLLGLLLQLSSHVRSFGRWGLRVQVATSWRVIR